MTYQEAVEYISQVPKFTKKTDASNTRELLKRLGHPERDYKVIHVAGTNGKGSVCAFMAGVLQQAGCRTGLFISPHLVTINERFQINRRNVSDEEFARAFTVVMDNVSAMMKEGFSHPAYFELLFAAGMLIFSWEKVEYLVMETGLGGRLDATNTVEHPLIVVITSISLDHTEYLGDTVEKIAAEKAGIIKEGVPVVYDGRDRRAEAVILEKARQMHAPAYPFYEAMAEIEERTDKSIAFVLNNRYYDYKMVRVPFPADYQVVNSSLAMTALRVMDPSRRIPDEVVLEGIAHTVWEGRMEQVMPGVIVDGAHNEDGIREFLKTARRIAGRRPVSLLFSAVSDKDYEKMIQEICEEVSFQRIVVTQITGSRRTDAELLAEIFRKYTDTEVISCSETAEAFILAAEKRKEGETLFCVGSLYLAGEIKALLKNAGLSEGKEPALTAGGE